MTKSVPLRRWALEKRDGNQEDAHAPGLGARPVKDQLPLQQQHSPDWDEHSESSRPTSLEQLLDLELDLVLPATAVPAPMSNQRATSGLNALRGGTHFVYLAYAMQAMQSPHGENQQWQSEEEEQNAGRHAAFARPECSPRRQMKDMVVPRKHLPLNLVSPTAFVPSFPPSPSQPSADDDYGLASPMALPDTPSQTRSGIALAWDFEPPSPTLDDVQARAEAIRRFAQSKSVQRPERRASSTAVAARAATPNPRSHRNYAPDRAASRLTRSSLPTLPEVRGKARHGGIYSLLLKNKSAKQEPVLVEDAHNPEEGEAGALTIDYCGVQGVQDDMADLMEDMNEIQEIMGRSIGDEIDEDELEAELEGLEEEWAEEEALGEDAEQAPSYLAPAQHHELPAAPSGTLESGRAAHATDEFGLPVASYST
ncbi:unnamed protein product [Phytophthora fragariaefolia]|uniref:Unnamed protein product n=1 Tax=Phytophthora fragariaefolia TaxID=1490495 RepID=A0A9W6XN05_9STRA|nr:unnamed protein product [Phytophthora fragariaefolia]